MRKIQLLASSSIAWTWDVEFQILEKSYKAYVHPSWNSSVRGCFGNLKEVFNVRTACDLLQSLDEDGLSGNQLKSIKVTGIDGWEADLLKMASIVENSPCAEQLEFLLQLSDEDLDWIWLRTGTFTSDEALNIVADLSGVFYWSASNIVTIDQILDELQIDRNASLENLIRRLASFKLAEEARLKSVSKAPVSFDSLEGFLESKDKLSIDDLTFCTNLPSPNNLETLSLILDHWLSASVKPSAMKLFNLGWRSELGFLPWAFGKLDEAAIQSYASQHKNECTVIKEWIREKIQMIESDLKVPKNHNQASYMGERALKSFIKWGHDLDVIL